MKNRQELIEATQRQLELWDSRLTELEHEMGAKSERAKREAMTRLDKLRADRRSLSKRLEAAKDAAAEGWMQLEGDLSDAVDSFREGATRMLEEIRK